MLRLVDRQIVSLARAFISDPHLLLLNKPTVTLTLTLTLTPTLNPSPSPSPNPNLNPNPHPNPTPNQAIFEQGLRHNFFHLLEQWTRREGIFASSHESFLRGEAEGGTPLRGGPSLSISSNEFKVRLINPNPNPHPHHSPFTQTQTLTLTPTLTLPLTLTKVRLINRTVNLMPRDVIFSTAEGVPLPRETTHLATFELSGEVPRERVTCRVKEYEHPDHPVQEPSRFARTHTKGSPLSRRSSTTEPPTER